VDVRARPNLPPTEAVSRGPNMPTAFGTCSPALDAGLAVWFAGLSFVASFPISFPVRRR